MSTLNITTDGSYTVSESDLTITIATDEVVTLTGVVDTTFNEVVIKTTADNANLTINNLNISNASNPIITFGNGTDNTFNFTGANTFEVKNGPGACVNVGGDLTINGTVFFKALRLTPLSLELTQVNKNPTAT